MSDYNVTRSAATQVTDRFSRMLRDLEDDFEEEYDLHVLQTRKRRRTTMDVKETLTGVLQTNAAIEIMNEIVLHALQSSRDTCAEMLEQIEAKRDRKGLWSSAEAQDWESLVEDIGALNRVIDYYGGYDE